MSFSKFASASRRRAVVTSILLVAGFGSTGVAAEGESAEDAIPAPVAILMKEGVKYAYPRYSPDGSRILFQSNEDGTWRIEVMDPDGKNRKALTSGEANDNFPDWSPDGSRIAFTSDRDGDEDVFVMNADGSDPRNLTKNPSRDIHPYWSTDGEKILFNSTRDVERLQLYEMNPDGSDPSRLVESEDDDTCARVSPDGKRILYLTNLLAAGRDDVIVRDRDGKRPRNLTDDRNRDGWPTWTRDGKAIVYSSLRDGSFGLFVMPASGGDAKRLTSPPAGSFDARAHVAPGNDRIVFNRECGATIGIYVLPARLELS